MRSSSREDRRRGHVLYLTYDGLCDPISQSQVLPYVLGLADRGYRMTILSFEKPDAPPSARDYVAEKLGARGIRWRSRAYRRGSAGRNLALHLADGVEAALRIAKDDPFFCAHARSYVPALLARTLKGLLGSKMIFDMRGFWIDEKVDSGLWPKGRLYHAAKLGEPHLFAGADAIVSLTHAGEDILESWPRVARRQIPIRVIPTCVEIPPSLPARRTSRPLTLAYVGSLGARYLLEPMLDIFRHVKARRSDARLLFFTRSAPEPLWEAARRLGIEGAIELASIPHREVVPRLAADADATLSLILPGFTSQASCPTKFGESLAAGCPVVVNDGVGDCARIVRERRVGVVAQPGSEGAAAAAADLLALLDEGQPLRQRCFEVAKERFDLARGVDAFEEVYRLLGGEPEAAVRAAAYEQRSRQKAHTPGAAEA